MKNDVGINTEIDTELHTIWKLIINAVQAGNAPPEMVCCGLCTAEQWQRMKKGEFPECKLLEDAFLNRLGFALEQFETLLEKEEYRRWKLRQDIIVAVAQGETETAECLLSRMEHMLSMSLAGYPSEYSHLERQFMLTMRANLCLPEGEERCRLYQEALLLTVPDMGQVPLSSLLLSEREWNLVLECCRTGKMDEQKKQARYEEILACLEHQFGENNSILVKLYPKAVFLLCGEIVGQQNPDWTVILYFCNRALEILRTGARLYYRLELYRYKMQALLELSSCSFYSSRLVYEDEYQEIKEEYEFLLQLYDTYQIPPEMDFDAYLYWETNTWFLGDIIRNRRETLGWNRVQLAEQAFCDVRTLAGIEKGTRHTQNRILSDVLQSLKLPPAMRYAMVVSEYPGWNRLLLEYNYDINFSKDYGKARILLQQLRQFAPETIEYNRMFFQGQEINMKLVSGKAIQKEQLLQELSLISSNVLSKTALCPEWEIKYLLQPEIYSLTVSIGLLKNNAERAKVYLHALNSYSEMLRRNHATPLFISEYALIVTQIADCTGSNGNFDVSDDFCQLIIREDLKQRRCGYIHFNLYNFWWNWMERKKKGIPVEDAFRDAKKELQNCLLAAKFCHAERHEPLYKKKLESL